MTSSSLLVLFGKAYILLLKLKSSSNTNKLDVICRRSPVVNQNRFFLPQVEVDKLSDSLKRLQEQFDNEKEENKVWSEKLEQTQKSLSENSESFELAKNEFEEQLEKLKLESQSHLEKSVSLSDELKLKCIEIEQTREKVTRLELEIESRVEEAANLSREVDSLRKCLRENEKKLADFEKEILSSNDRERAQKELKDQMIGYQKDLQDQIRY